MSRNTGGCGNGSATAGENSKNLIGLTAMGFMPWRLRNTPETPFANDQSTEGV
jgi:hypothetical protein